MKTIITSPKAPAPIGPYSHAVLAGNTLYVSGQVAKDAASGNIINETIEAEAHKVMENVGNILAEANFGFENVVKTTIFLKDLNNFGTVNEVYGSFFKGNFPARETVEVSKLPLNVNIEISVIAVK